MSDRAREDFSVEADHLSLRHPGLVSHLVLYASGARALIDSAAWPAMRDLIFADWELAKRAVAAVVVDGAPRSDLDAFVALMQQSATLLNAYRKLGVRSRAEAAAAVSRRTA